MTRAGRARAKRITKSSLEEAALFQLERRALSVVQLRRLLERKVKRAEREHGPAPEAAAFIDDILARCEASGLLDDARVAEGRVRALRAAGTSSRGIAHKLRLNRRVTSSARPAGRPTCRARRRS